MDVGVSVPPSVTFGSLWAYQRYRGGVSSGGRNSVTTFGTFPEPRHLSSPPTKVDPNPIPTSVVFFEGEGPGPTLLLGRNMAVTLVLDVSLGGIRPDSDTGFSGRSLLSHRVVC